MNVTLTRKAQPSDDKAISSVLMAAFSNLYTTMNVKMPAQRAACLAEPASKRLSAQTLVCEADGNVVGSVTLIRPCSISEAWIENAWDLRFLAVDPLHQGQGLARMLIGEAETLARSEGATAICLHARRGVVSQARLYFACGYEHDPAGDIDADPFREGYVKRL